MNKPLVFIIEDDIETSKIFSIALQSEFEIESFQDGNAALDRLQQINPAVITLDLNMPSISGGDILKKIRADERLASIPVILVTADTVQAESLREEADLVLIKPISPLQLRELAVRIRSRDA